MNTLELRWDRCRLIASRLLDYSNAIRFPQTDRARSATERALLAGLPCSVTFLQEGMRSLQRRAANAVVIQAGFGHLRPAEQIAAIEHDG